MKTEKEKNPTFVVSSAYNAHITLVLHMEGKKIPDGPHCLSLDHKMREQNVGSFYRRGSSGSERLSNHCEFPWLVVSDLLEGLLQVTTVVKTKDTG